jgi:Putative peptidoglycan binding domain/L,D-transpeptidase catalytic domain
MNRDRILRPTLGAALALAALGGAGGCAAGSQPPASAAASRSASVPAPAPASARPATPSPATGSPARPAPSATPPSSPPAPAGPLRLGDSGPAVLRLQQRLTDLGYWVGALDGRFGGITQQGVFALQKAAHLTASGRVTSATQAALDKGVRPTARSHSGHVVEVNLARGLLLFVTAGHVDHVLNTSTGGGYVYYDQGVREVARTPKGHFTTYRVIDGPRRSSLGLLIRPRYFVRGYAIHGDSSVPARPVSHGCVRVTNAAIDWIWSANLDPIGTPVWVY